MPTEPRIAERLRRLAIEAFENEAGAERWLKTPQLGLHGAVPLDYADCEERAQEVENLLRRIDWHVLP